MSVINRRVIKFATSRYISSWCSPLPITCSVHCLGFLEWHNTSVFYYLFSI